PWAASPPRARIGTPRMMSWFHTPVTTTASPTGRPLNPHDLSIANDEAIPTAAPPGATVDMAVEARVTLVACRYDSPGSAAIHGGPYVAVFRTTDRISATIHCHSMSLATSHTSP